MAVTLKIFILFLGVVIVKSHHLQHDHNRYQDNHRPNFIDNIFHMFGSGFFGNGNSQSDGFAGLFNNYDGMGHEGSYAPSNTGIDYQDYGQYDNNNVGGNIPDQNNVNIGLTNEPQTPDFNLNIAVPNGSQKPGVNFNTVVPNGPQTPDVNLNIALPNKPQSPDFHFNITVPTAPQSPDVHVDTAVPNSAQAPDVNINIAVPNEPPTSDVQDLNSPANEGSVNNVIVNAPANTNGHSDETQREPKVLDNHADINLSQTNRVPDYVEIPNINADAGLKTAAGYVDSSGPSSQNNPGEENGNLIAKNVPGFTDNDVNKGIVMVDPELKYNINVAHDANKAKLSQNIGESSKTDDEKAVPGLNDEDLKAGKMMIDPKLKINEVVGEVDKYSDAVVFPDDIDEAKKQNQVNTDDKQNLPDRFSSGDSNKENSSIIAPVIALTTMSASNFVPSQWAASNNGQTIPTSNNQGPQNQYTKPNSVVFGQSLNQQVPVNNGNESPYVNVVRNPNGEYTVVNIPNNNNGQNPSHVYISGSSAVNIPDQGYVSGNSVANNPAQSYVSGNSVVNNPGQGYESGNSVANNPGLSYVSGSSAVNNPGQVYVSGNSGVNNPDQSYVLVNSGIVNPDKSYVSGNSGLNNPGQIYVSGSSSLNNPGQAYIPVNVNSAVTNPGQTYIGTNAGNSQYVPADSGANNAGQMYVSNDVPSSGSQTTCGGHYNVIQLSNGQIVLQPVNGNGQNVQWNGQSNNGQIVLEPVNGNGQNVQWNGQSNNGQIVLEPVNGNGQNVQWNGQSNNGQTYVPVNYIPGQGYQTLGSNPTGNVVNLGSSGNVVTSRPTNNVPLLISYKDKDGENEEKSAELDHDHRKEE